MKLKQIAMIAAGALLIGCGKGQAQTLLDNGKDWQSATPTVTDVGPQCAKYMDGRWWTTDGGCPTPTAPSNVPSIPLTGGDIGPAEPLHDTIIVCLSHIKDDGELTAPQCTEVK